jgi:hypothetical protein
MEDAERKDAFLDSLRVRQAEAHFDMAIPTSADKLALILR